MNEAYIITRAQLEEVTRYLMQRPWHEANPLIVTLANLAPSDALDTTKQSADTRVLQLLDEVRETVRANVNGDARPQADDTGRS